MQIRMNPIFFGEISKKCGSEKSTILGKTTPILMDIMVNETTIQKPVTNE
jgi:hypothetical protein